MKDKNIRAIIEEVNAHLADAYIRGWNNTMDNAFNILATYPDAFEIIEKNIFNDNHFNIGEVEVVAKLKKRENGSADDFGHGFYACVGLELVTEDEQYLNMTPTEMRDYCNSPNVKEIKKVKTFLRNKNISLEEFQSIATLIKTHHIAN